MFRGSYTRYLCKRFAYYLSDLLFLIPVIISAIISRFVKKEIIGVGPLPSINSHGHKKSLEAYNYKVETFVDSLWFYTNKFDVIPPRFMTDNDFFKLFISYYLFFRSIYKYKILYFYFNGCFFRRNSLLMYLEPFIYKIAKIKTVILAYGMDVQDQRITKSILYKDAYISDYPDFRFYNNEVSKKINLWQKYGDFILAGCDWVKYLFYWDDVIVSHFTVDFEKLEKEKKKSVPKKFDKENPLKIVHAPNHRNLKGTDFFLSEVKKLKSEGYFIELEIIEGISNSEVIKKITNSDIVLDQLVIGWYAVFSIEGMALSKCVMCYLEDELLDFYKIKGLIKDIPIVNINFKNFSKKVIELYNNPSKLQEIGKKLRNYGKANHSYDFIGKKFDNINKEILKNE